MANNSSFSNIFMIIIEQIVFVPYLEYYGTWILKYIWILKFIWLDSKANCSNDAHSCFNEQFIILGVR